MLICQCLAVNEATVRGAMLAGAREPSELASRCGAGSRCGGCLSTLVELLEAFAVADPDVRTSAA